MVETGCGATKLSQYMGHHDVIDFHATSAGDPGGGTGNLESGGHRGQHRGLERARAKVVDAHERPGGRRAPAVEQRANSVGGGAHRDRDIGVNLADGFGEQLAPKPRPAGRMGDDHVVGERLAQSGGRGDDPVDQA